MLESAKLCFLRTFVPYVLSCLTGIVTCALVPHVSCALLALVPQVFCVVRALGPTCFVPWILSCLTCCPVPRAMCLIFLVLYVLLYLTCCRALRAPRVLCLTSFMCQSLLFCFCFPSLTQLFFSIPNSWDFCGNWQQLK